MPDASHEPADGADAGAPALAHARTAVADAAARLAAAGARSEVLAEFVAERRVLGIPRAARMRPLGRVWRLGVLLVAADAGAAGLAPLFGLGRVVRAEPPARRSVVANAIAEHRAYRVAAVKGGIAAGETVDFDAVPLRLDGAGDVGGAGPVLVRDGRMLVRWSPTQPEALAPLDRYLSERVDLLLDPPGGA
ncbi:hypothetical protein ACWKWP_12800 [Agromyces soli]